MTQGQGYNIGQSHEMYEHHPQFLNPLTGGWTEGAKWCKFLLITNIVVWAVMMISCWIWGSGASA